MSTFEFHVARAARERYRFDEALFGLSGNVVFADYAAARRFAALMNEQRDLATDPGAAVRAGDINAMGLVDEILHFVVGMYRRERNPRALSGALEALRAAAGSSVARPDAPRLRGRVPERCRLPRRAIGARTGWTMRRTARRTARSRSKSCSWSGSRTATRRLRRTASFSMTATSRTAAPTSRSSVGSRRTSGRSRLSARTTTT